MDLAPNAGTISLPGVRQELRLAPSSSQTFSHITASGSSQVHNGNRYYITYNCSTGHDLQSRTPSDTYQDAEVRDCAKSSQKRKRRVDDALYETHGSRERQTLSTVLESLGQYSKSIQQLSEDEDSRKIAAQLTVILESLEQAVTDGLPTDDLNQDLHDIRDQLLRAKRIKINAALPQAHASRPYKVESKFTAITTGRWEIWLNTKTLHSRSTFGQMLTETCSALRIQRALGFQGPRIAVFFGESVDIDQTVTMHPTVLVYNQVHNGANVFKLVENDDLEGLMRHLALGQASMRDCDEDGRSLLHYACFYSSTKTCKYLVESGCDVDLIAKPGAEVDWLATPLISFADYNPEIDGASLERYLICRTILLQAGADPTIDPWSNNPELQSTSMIQASLEWDFGWHRSTSAFELVLREGSAFIDVRKYQIDDQTVWQYACSNAYTIISPKILQILVQAGVAITEVEEDGWNCLFECVMNARDPSTSAELEALQYLLTIFDNIFACDSYRFTIFDNVTQDEAYSGRIWGSYRQDLWYCALYRSGLASRFDIPPPPPGPVLSSSYTIQHYRALLRLDIWDFGIKDERITDYPLVDKVAPSQRDRETATGLRGWSLPDLLMMEERIDRAVYLADDDDENELPAVLRGALAEV